ncbi:MAG: pyridoxamine 5'-phosphate oxidase family protein [bacterium]|nr:pyridoxamine 5'-phosphate oxidase family protein [bacterium]
MSGHILNEIKLLLAAQAQPTAFLATQDEKGHPRVRPITLMVTPQGFYVATSRKSRKAAEIRRHKFVEWVTLLPGDKGTGYLRLAGEAQEINGEEKLRTVEESDYPIKLYWSGVNDPDFVVYRILPQRVEYIRPGENDFWDVTETFQAGSPD